VLFPNPTKNVFNLNQIVKSVVIYNLYGTKILEFKDQYQNMDLSNINTGIYFVCITDEYGSKKTLKLVKE
jgi:hypothetical protein